MNTTRSISAKAWDEIDEFVGRIQYRAIECRDWELAKDADRITTILRSLPEESHTPSTPLR